MTSQPPDDSGHQHGVSFSIHADGVLHGLSFEARAENPDDARALIDHFWSSLARHVRGAAKAGRGDDDVAKIRARMLELGMMQSDLARSTGLETSHVSQIFTGKIGLSARSRLKIFKVLGMPSGGQANDAT